MKNKITAAWYSDAAWLNVLKPLSAVYGAVANRRRQAFLQQAESFPVPVIVVGNITVGGTGKTPVVKSVVQYLQSIGRKPAVISRGYGGVVEPEQLPLSVTNDADPTVCGDEPAMLAASLDCPVIVDPKRIRAALFALQEFDVDVIVSDDGLQHYALPRHFELAIIDGSRGFGNHALLPAGPLREPPSRLVDVDFVLVNGETEDDTLSMYTSFEPTALEFVQVNTGRTIAIADWRSEAETVAIAAIGNPQRFADTLHGLDIQVPLIAFPDHHFLQRDDMPAAERILMTEKDAVKCRRLNDDRLWYLRIHVELPTELKHDIHQLLMA